jgi:hypothetical protein
MNRYASTQTMNRYVSTQTMNRYASTQRSQTISKINNNINMDSTIAGQGILIVNGLLARTIESIG